MNNWVDRTAYAAILGFLAGVAITVIAFALFLRLHDGGDDNENGGGATPTTTATPQSTKPAVVTQTPPQQTPTAGTFTDPDDALAAYVEGTMSETYVGACPEQPPPNGTQGICSFELYRSEELLTAFVGPALSEAVGEVVVTKDGAQWTVDFVPVPAPAAALAVGSNAVVYGAGDCLIFHSQASADPATRTSCQIDGTRARVAEGPVQAGDATWWRLENLGWASGQYLVPTQ